jgi:hypothetical protein
MERTSHRRPGVSVSAKTIPYLKTKIRVQETAHVRAFVRGDHETAAEHRAKIKELKTELARAESQ